MAALTTARRVGCGAIPGQSARAAAAKSMMAQRIWPELQLWLAMCRREKRRASKRLAADRRDETRSLRADSAFLAAHKEHCNLGQRLLASVLQDASESTPANDAKDRARGYFALLSHSIYVEANFVKNERRLLFTGGRRPRGPIRANTRKAHVEAIRTRMTRTAKFRLVLARLLLMRGADRRRRVALGTL